MSAFAGSWLSADDVSAMHTRYQDAMHGTFAADRHHNLPRPLRSYVAHDSSRNTHNISVLSTTPAPAATSRGVFRTPQWNEFSNYVRELAPPSVESRNTETEDEEEEGGEDDVAETLNNEAAAYDSQGNGARDTVSEYGVVDRLDELSRSPNADPNAVAAALRAAEKMLKHPANGDAAPSRRRGGKHVSNSDDAYHLRQQGSIRDWKQDEGRRVSEQRHPLGRAEHFWEGDVADRLSKHDHRGLQDHHHRLHSNSDYNPQSAAWSVNDGNFPTASFSSNVNQPWPWPFSHSDAPGAIPYPTPATTPPTTADAAAHWYEVYYAWMLYYQQLYATQILQQEQQQRRAQRREARRERSAHRARHHNNDNDDHHHHHSLNHSTANSQHRREVRTLTRPRPDEVRDDERSQHRRRHPDESVELPLQERSARSHSLKQRSSHGREVVAGDTQQDEPVDDSRSRMVAKDSRGETAQLRTQLQQLEAQLAALSARVLNDNDDNDEVAHVVHKSSMHNNNQHDSSNSSASDARRATREDVKGRASPRRAAAQAAAKPRQRNIAALERANNVEVSPRPKAASAGTWQGLAERQRSRSGTHRVRRASTSPQRPQWK